VRSEAPKPAAKSRPGASKNGAASQAKLEREIEQAEAALRAVEDELADPDAWSTPERSAKSTARHDAAKRAVDDLYARYEQLVG